MKSFQKQAAKAQTDALVDPNAVETEDTTKHTSHKSGHAPQQNQAKGHMQAAKADRRAPAARRSDLRLVGQPVATIPRESRMLMGC